MVSISSSVNNNGSSKTTTSLSSSPKIMTTTTTSSSGIKWTRVFGCTYKALALYRISLGILLVLELILRYRFLHPFYSDEGTLPLRLLLPKVDEFYKLVCIHCQFGALWQQQVLLTIQVIAGVCFTVGYQTKLATIISWYLYFSSTLRNTWLSFILDRYFHYLLFYAMFLPLDFHYWSISNSSFSSSFWQQQGKKRQPQQQQRGMLVSPATIALKVLVFWIYLDAGSGKYMDPLQGWTFNAQPLPALDTYTRHTLVARYMYALLGPFGLRCLTPTVVWVELLAAPVAFVGSYLGNALIVNIAIALICSLHVGISMCINNAVLLSLVACCVWCIFLPIGWNNHNNNTGSTTATTTTNKTQQQQQSSSLKSNNNNHGSIFCFSTILILSMVTGNLWFAMLSNECDQSVKHIWSSLLHNRWNVFVGAEEYVTWEIAPGLLADGSIVDVWGRKDTVDWSLPGSGAPCTSTARSGRWRSFPYLAGLEGDDGDALWSYLCRQWDAENHVDDDPFNNGGRKLIKFNFFMLQADVLPNMGFSPTRKRLIQSYDCTTTTTKTTPGNNTTTTIISKAIDSSTTNNNDTGVNKKNRYNEREEEDNINNKEEDVDNAKKDNGAVGSSTTDEL